MTTAPCAACREEWQTTTVEEADQALDAHRSRCCAAIQMILTELIGVLTDDSARRHASRNDYCGAALMAAQHADEQLRAVVGA